MLSAQYGTCGISAPDKHCLDHCTVCQKGVLLDIDHTETDNTPVALFLNRLSDLLSRCIEQEDLITKVTQIALNKAYTVAARKNRIRETKMVWM